MQKIAKHQQSSSSENAAFHVLYKTSGIAYCFLSIEVQYIPIIIDFFLHW